MDKVHIKVRNGGGRVDETDAVSHLEHRNGGYGT